jgi:hypothetical protein
MHAKITSWSLSVGPFSMEGSPAFLALVMLILLVGIAGGFLILFMIARNGRNRSGARRDRP